MATSFKEAVADTFIERALENHRGSIKWRFEVDKRGATDARYRCCHVNLVQTGSLNGEWEYLFTAYSVFTVKEVHVSPMPDSVEKAHRITLTASKDNTLESEELPLAPWH